MKDRVLEITFKLLLQIAFFYAFLIHFHGEESPGGGFQAGALIGSVFIIYQYIFYNEDFLISQRIIDTLLFTGIMLYCGFGLILLSGGNFLEFNALTQIGLKVATAQKIGIMIVETGVLLVVSMSMVKIHYALKKLFDE